MKMARLIKMIEISIFLKREGKFFDYRLEVVDGSIHR